MEEIYIVKLKGLPPPNNLTSQDAFAKDAKTSFYYQTDLTAEAIRGFSYLHIFFGITVLCLSVTNLCFHDNPMGLAPPLGITLWCAISFILLGFWGIITAFKRKCDLSGSIIFVKIQLFLIIIVLSLTLIFAILFVLDRHGPIANQFIGWNILFSMIVESVILLLTLFTCARVLWPGCIHFCAKDWPMQPNLKRKMIVKTNVFTNAIQQDKASIIQSFGPNCVISLNMPPTMAPSSSTVSASASDPAVSSNGSSLCSSPTTYNKNNNNLNNKIYSPSVSTSDLAKSLSTIFAIQDDTGFALDNQQQIAKISTNSIYYNYPNVGVCTANLLQTFPTADQQNRQLQNGGNNGSSNKIDLQNIYQQPMNNINNHSGQSWYRGSDTYSGSEGIDPYDTDEFDYCSSTEDEEDNRKATIANDECHKSSSDDGNGTLEEDSKSITNSVSSNTTNNTSSDLVTSDECVSLSPKKIDHQYPIECINYSHIDDDDDEDHNNDDNIINEQNNKATSIEIKTGINNIINNSQLKLSSIKQAIENINLTPTTITNYNDDVVKPEMEKNLEDNDHVQIINQIELNGVNTTTEQSSSPYKSSIIKIESPLPMDQSIKTSANVPQSIDGAILNSNANIVNNNNNNNNDNTNNNNNNNKINNNNNNKSSSNSGSTTTIRLLKTDKPITKNKFNAFRIEQRHLNDDNLTNTNNNNNTNSYLAPKITNKLASHPYLCRLRASNVESMERQHSKYLVKNSNDSVSNTTAAAINNNNNNTINKLKPPPPPPSPPTNNAKLGLVSKQIVQFINDSHKIPDIERV